MAWNEDGWRLARETYDSIRRAVNSVDQAAAALQAQDPELAQRLLRARGTRARDLNDLSEQFRQTPELPDTEPEARRSIELARRWKTVFGTLDSELAEDARQGRNGLTLPDHGALGPAGWTDARLAVANVPWQEVTRLMAVPMNAPRQPPVPPAPPRPRPPRRGGTPWLPLAALALLLLSSKKG